MQHLVVLVRKPVRLAQKVILIRFHTRILTSLCHFFAKDHLCSRQESDLHRRIRTAELYPLSYGSAVRRPCTLALSIGGLNVERLAQAILIKTDDNILIDRNHRHSHLAALLHHFLALREIFGDIVFREYNIILTEKVLRRMAEVAGRGRINRHFR